MRRATTIAAALAAMSGCAVEPDSPPPGGAQAAIIGGINTVSEPGTVGLRMCVGGGCATCTGTLVGAQTVLTAAHCVDANVAAGAYRGIDVFFGDDMSGSGTWVEANFAVVHRFYDPDTLDYDIAMVHIEEPGPPDIDPVVLNARWLDDSDTGSEIKLVGFGETGYQVGDSGVKRRVFSRLNLVAPRHLFVGTEDSNTCKGDSGGPTFLDFGQGWEQIGVTSRSQACAPNSVKIRVDVMLEDFVWPFIDRFEGACAFDGTCQAACPRNPDPDCDVCAWDGVCGTACAEADWDCPVGGRLGDACDSDTDCELRRCQIAPEDERVRYCSEPCDPATGFGCLGGMECVDEGGQKACVWPSPTPGVLGAPCVGDSDCRSTICEDGACVELCTEAPGGECGPDFECRPSAVVAGDVCAIPGGTGADGCECGASGGPRPWWLVLGLVVAVAFRRRGARGTPR